MTKILFLNCEIPEEIGIKRGISSSSIKDAPTLHDFHVLFFDTSKIFDKKWWNTDNRDRLSHDLGFFDDFKEKINEQIQTGGLTFCFCEESNKVTFADTKTSIGYSGNIYKETEAISQYFFCPIDLGIKSEKGSTFYPKFSNLGAYTPLIKKIPTNEVKWKCYFSEIPETTKILAVNRAEYPIFIEVTLGAGKLIMLPSFKNKSKAIQLIVNEIIPSLVKGNEIARIPDWVSDFSLPNESKLRDMIKKIEKTKQLLYTNGKALEKAVGFAFQLLGFEVKYLPEGSYADLILSDGKKKAFVEVKSHEKSLGTYRNVCQLLGRLEEASEDMKGIIVCNHEFAKQPKSRNKVAFTQQGITVAENSEISLLSTVDLFAIIQGLIYNDDDSKKALIRRKILDSSGIIQFNNSEKN